MMTYLEFEKPVAELQVRIRELKAAGDSSANAAADISRLEAKVEAQLKTLYSKLSPWQKTLVARHPARPHFKDIAASLLTDFTPLSGDRKYGDDNAIIGGPARFRGRPIMAMGHEKGTDTAGRLKHNFGMAKPEGYRKAVRLMEMADRFGLPVLTFVDTSGAFPGIQAEQRGQAEAVARSTEACLALGVPMVASIVGEGGSGGALALAAANRILMFEHAVYAVISPEGCASILWRTADKAPDAAEAMKQTAQDLRSLGLIDAIVPEPLGGAHRSPGSAIKALGDAVEAQLVSLVGLDAAALRNDRRSKFLAMGRTA